MDTDNPGQEPEERARLEQEIEVMRGLDALRRTGPWGESIVALYERAQELQELVRPQITVEMPAPVVVPAAEVRVDPVVVPDYTAVLSEMLSMFGRLVEAIAGLAPQVTVNVPEQPAPMVSVTVPEGSSTKRVQFKRDQAGRITSATVTEG